ncbi:hypothetical protein O5D80_003137 [Batrachochytrium dendrobatidis]|nr:hypothetical protein O5D80_003137 [Batrachochytrium dendrobatidis]
MNLIQYFKAHFCKKSASMSKKNIIVMFKDDTCKEVIDKAALDLIAQGGVVHHRYESSILGFSATVPYSLISVLEANEHVDSVELDGQVKTMPIKN